MINKVKNNKIITIGMIVLILLFCIIILLKNFQYNKQYYVDFQLIKTFSLKDKSQDTFYEVIHSQSVLNYFLEDSKHPFYKFKDLINQTKFNFNNSDYLFVLGGKLCKLRYSQKFSKEKDLCDYEKFIPIEAVYCSKEFKNSFFIYKIKKGLYRSPCP